MGNAAPRMRQSHDYATATATGGGRKRRCSKNAEPANVASEGWPGENVAGGRVADGNSAAVSATGVTVKVVLRRKDAEKLIARLNEQSARGRKARMAEIKNELRAGDAAPSPARCRDGWTHRLAPIQE
uniref:Uncharacterized protein n=1 Tax=Leersia perrieri TaxID=77586 RepID=A0A0D9V470_9ORYZ